MEIKRGYWRTRNGSEAYVIDPNAEPGGDCSLQGACVLGVIKYNKPGSEETVWWTNAGRYIESREDEYDLVEYLGSDKPKRKVTKTVECWMNVDKETGAMLAGSFCSAVSAFEYARGHHTQVKLTGSYECEE